MKRIVACLFLSWCANALGFAEADQAIQRAVEITQARVELEKMRAEDQAVRFGFDDLQKAGYSVQALQTHTDYMQFMAAIDRHNTEQLKKVIAKFGWPTISKFDRVSDTNAFLIVQHSNDLKFQKAALALIKQALLRNDTNAGHYALLWDRVQVNQGKPQRYGTQGTCAGKKQFRLHPLEKPAQLAQLRASVGLPPIAIYLKQVAEYCH